MLHRRRERIMKQRMMLINQTRGLLADFGLVIPRQVKAFYRGLPGLLGDAGYGLTPVARADVRSN